MKPEQVMGESRRGRKVVITGDTAPCEMTRVAAHEAELLVHDGCFADEESARAAETGHSTARQAAELARDAEASMLALVHISSRYHVKAVLGEAREAFPEAHAVRDFDLVEIPFPERGEPRLVEGGAKAQREGPDPEPAAAVERDGTSPWSREVGDRLGDRLGLVLLEEVLRRQQIASSTPRTAGRSRSCGPGRGPGRASPQTTAAGHVAARAGPRQRSARFSSVSSKPRMIFRKARPPSVAMEQGAGRRRPRRGSRAGRRSPAGEDQRGEGGSGRREPELAETGDRRTAASSRGGGSRRRRAAC